MNQPTLSTAVVELTFPCPVCSESVTSRDYSTTLVGYRSCFPHNHDGNCRKFMMECSSGHEFLVRPIMICPLSDCTWRGSAYCEICGNWLQLLDMD